MRRTDYQMVAFEGDLNDVTRKFNDWASGDDGVEIVNVQFTPDTHIDRYVVVIFYKKEVYKVKKLTPDKCKPVIERPTPKDLIKQSTLNPLDSEILLQTLRDISRELAGIDDAMSFGRCVRCQNPVRDLKYDIHVLKRLLGWDEKEENKND